MKRRDSLSLGGSDTLADAQQVATPIRRHWGVENELHWVLDMAFREDEARHRARNTAQNMTLLRHFAINIIKQDSNRKAGVANSRKRAGWDRNYLLSLLVGAKAWNSIALARLGRVIAKSFSRPRKA